VPFASGPVTEFLAGYLVQPPPELAVSDARLNVLSLGFFTDGNETTAAYNAWGIHAHDHVSFELLQDTPALRVAQVGATEPGLTITLTTTVHPPSTTEMPGKARIFIVEDKQVRGVVDVSWTQGRNFWEGTGTLQWDTGTSPSPFPLPFEPGRAAHIWGDDYDYNYTFARIAPAAPPNGTFAA
jgi:hypothetical protein